MNKKYKEEIGKRIKSRIEKNLGSPRFRWFIIILNLFIFSIVYLYSLLTWGKDVAIQYFVQTVVSFIVFEFVVYFGLICFWRYFSIPVEIFNEQNKEIEDLSSLLNSPVSITVQPDQDEISGTYTFKQIRLINQSHQSLLSCFATIESFCEILPDKTRKYIEPVSRQISWANTGRRTSDNKVDLIAGIPEKLYVARVGPDDKQVYLMGERGNNTLLKKKGKYLLQIRLIGGNFSPQIFSVKFDYSGKNTIKVTDISKPSLVSFFDTTIGINSKGRSEATLSRKEKGEKKLNN